MRTALGVAPSIAPNPSQIRIRREREMEIVRAVRLEYVP